MALVLVVGAVGGYALYLNAQIHRITVTHFKPAPQKGADVGTEYRSVIFYTTDEQKRQAEAFIAELNASDTRGNPIVTEVSPLEAFYEAEDYHREYFRNNAALPYCQFVIAPKLTKLHKNFGELLKSSQMAAEKSRIIG